MKKSILIVVAIAITFTILSCKKKHPNNDKGLPATMTLTIEGSQDVGSKAAGTPDAMENHINSLDIMVFQGLGGDAVLDERKYFVITGPGTSSYNLTLPITQGALRSVHVVANIPEEDFANVTKLSDLWDIETKRILDTVHTGVNLAMSGTEHFSVSSESVFVTVELKYVPSVVYFTFTPPTGVASITTFEAQKVFLLNVKEESDYFTDYNAAVPASLSANVNDFAHGVSNHADYSGQESYPSTADNNSYSTGLATTSDISGGMTHDSHFFYILENHNTDHPTTIVLEALINGTTTYYYPIVLNGDQNTRSTFQTKAGDGSFKVKRGQEYKVSATINDVGTPNPFEKIEAADATITIETAVWPIAPNFIDQEFN